MEESIVNCYTTYGILFALTRSENLTWIYNDFIQLRYAEAWGIFIFDEHEMLLANCPYLNFYIVPNELFVQKYNNSIEDLIVELIDLGFYLFLYVDRYYMPAYKQYKKENTYNMKLLFQDMI